MAIAKIQQGDEVKITAGNYKGLVGKVVKVFRKKDASGKILSTRAAVSSIPKIAKYKKSNRAYNLPGMQTEVDRKVDVSNLSLVTSVNELSKVKIELKDGKKVRILKKDSSLVEKKHETKEDKNDKEISNVPDVKSIKKTADSSVKKDNNKKSDK